VLAVIAGRYNQLLTVLTINCRSNRICNLHHWMQSENVCAGFDFHGLPNKKARIKSNGHKKAAIKQL